jgi:hypothetical protein
MPNFTKQQLLDQRRFIEERLAHNRNERIAILGLFETVETQITNLGKDASPVLTPKPVATQKSHVQSKQGYAQGNPKGAKRTPEEQSRDTELPEAKKPKGTSSGQKSLAATTGQQSRDTALRESKNPKETSSGQKSLAATTGQQSRDTALRESKNPKETSSGQKSLTATSAATTGQQPGVTAPSELEKAKVASSTQESAAGTPEATRVSAQEATRVSAPQGGGGNPLRTIPRKNPEAGFSWVPRQ